MCITSINHCCLCCVKMVIIISFISYHTFKHLVTCPDLTGPANGQVAESGSNPPFTAKYTCNTGYRLVGDSPRTCQENGQWSGTTPTCEPSKYGIIISKDILFLPIYVNKIRIKVSFSHCPLIYVRFLNSILQQSI